MVDESIVTDLDLSSPVYSWCVGTRLPPADRELVPRPFPVTVI